MDRELELHFRKQGEGRVYLHRWFTQIPTSQDFHFNENYYTIKDGKVCEIEKDGSLFPTGDSCYECVTKGKDLGLIDLNNLPVRKFYTFDIEMFKPNMGNDLKLYQG